MLCEPPDPALRWATEAANDRARRVLRRWACRLLGDGFQAWSSSARAAGAEEIQRSHAEELAAARTEAANDRARRVLCRWACRLLSEGFETWCSSARAAGAEEIRREKLPQSLFTIVSTFVFHRLARAFRKWIDVMFYAHVCRRRAVERLFYSTRAWKYRQAVSRAFSLWFRRVVSTQVMHELIELSRGHLRGLRARILRRVRSVLVGYRRHTARTFVHWLHFALWRSAARPPLSFDARAARLATPSTRPGYGRAVLT